MRCPKCRRERAPEFGLCYFHAWKDRVRMRKRQGIKHPERKLGRPVRMPDEELERRALEARQ